jgi:branched-chain amino acid transport system substrate-binding protein
MRLWRLGVCSLVIAFAGCREERVTVGVTVGASEAVAARLAYEDAVRGGLKAVDTVIVESAATEAGNAIRAAHRLTAIKGIAAVVGHGNSAASLAASQLYNARRVLQLAPHSTAALYSQAGAYSYRLVPPDTRQGQFLADALVAMARGKRVALHYVNDDYGRGLRRDLLAALPEGAVSLIRDVPHVERADSAARARIIAGIEKNRPEAILFLGRAEELQRLLPGIRRVAGAIPILGSDAVNGARMYANRDGRWNGVRYVELVDLKASAALESFGHRYRARTGHDPDGGDILT